MTDTELNTACLAYRSQMVAVAGKVLRNYADAEDAVQNALLRISQVCTPLPTDEKARRAYFVAAARNAALDLLPKQGKDDALDDLQIPAQEDVFEQLAALEDYERLLATIRQLPLKYREVLMLRYVQELETGEIAIVLGRSFGTVHKQISRAKAMLLRVYFGEQEEKL